MSINAVTQDASAVSERESASVLMPNDKKYRMTGELPERLQEGATQRKDNEDYVPDGVTEDLAAQETETKPSPSDSATEKPAETAAAPAAAPPQKKRDAEGRVKQLLDRIEQLERKVSTNPRETQREARPAEENKPSVDAEPTIQDKDDKGKFKYKTLAEFNAAVREYDRKRILEEVKTETAKFAKEREQKQAEEVVNRKLGERIVKAREKHPDYDSVALNPDLPIAKGSAVDLFTLDSDHGAEILYKLGKNPERLKEINAMHPLRQVRELTKMELDIEKPSVSSAKPVTTAPRPPQQVSGKGTVAKDAVEQAVADNDSEAYIKEQNARALARRKQGK